MTNGNGVLMCRKAIRVRSTEQSGDFRNKPMKSIDSDNRGTREGKRLVSLVEFAHLHSALLDGSRKAPIAYDT